MTAAHRRLVHRATVPAPAANPGPMTSAGIPIRLAQPIPAARQMVCIRAVHEGAIYCDPGGVHGRAPSARPTEPVRLRAGAAAGGLGRLTT